MGEREPEIYGTLTLADINLKLKRAAKELNASLKIQQSNHEGTLIDFLHRYRTWADGGMINPGAYTHYSYALRDAIASLSIPVVEVHLSDLTKRETFRRRSVVAPVCAKRVMGLGWKSYLEAMKYLCQK